MVGWVWRQDRRVGIFSQGQWENSTNVTCTFPSTPEGKKQIVDCDPRKTPHQRHWKYFQ